MFPPFSPKTQSGSFLFNRVATDIARTAVFDQSPIKSHVGALGARRSEFIICNSGSLANEKFMSFSRREFCGPPSWRMLPVRQVCSV